MVEPTSTPGEDGQDVATCRTCGEALTDHPDHRVVTWVEDDRVRTVHFCDRRCRSDWDRE